MAAGLVFGVTTVVNSTVSEPAPAAADTESAEWTHTFPTASCGAVSGVDLPLTTTRASVTARGGGGGSAGGGWTNTSGGGATGAQVVLANFDLPTTGLTRTHSRLAYQVGCGGGAGGSSDSGNAYVNGGGGGSGLGSGAVGGQARVPSNTFGQRAASGGGGGGGTTICLRSAGSGCAVGAGDAPVVTAGGGGGGGAAAKKVNGGSGGSATSGTTAASAWNGTAGVAISGTNGVTGAAGQGGGAGYTAPGSGGAGNDAAVSGSGANGGRGGNRTGGDACARAGGGGGGGGYRGGGGGGGDYNDSGWLACTGSNGNNGAAGGGGGGSSWAVTAFGGSRTVNNGGGGGAAVGASTNGNAGSGGSAAMTIWGRYILVDTATNQNDVAGTSVTPYSLQSALGGPPGSTYSGEAWSAANLPPGVTIDSTTGEMSGTPTAAGVYNVTVTRSATFSTGGAQAATRDFVWTVTAAPQTITFTSSAPTGAEAGDTYTVSATATSGLPVTFTTGDPAVCTVSGTTVTLTGSGNCIVYADQAGDAIWAPAPQESQSFAVAKKDQTITFTSTPPSPSNVGDTYTVSATATSGLPVTFSSADTSVCTVSGSTVSLVGVGVCEVRADQAGDTAWNAAPQQDQFFSVGKGSQTITFNSTPPDPAVIGGTYVVNASSNSGLPVTLSEGNPSVCSLSGTTVSLNSAGICVINANQAGDANWNAAPQAQQFFNVSKLAQTITFTSTPPTGAVIGDTYTVSATASSGLPVSFSSATPGVCTVSGSTVTLVADGPCLINANQAGDATYNPATQAQQVFNVSKQNQTITFDTTAPSPGYVSDTYAVSASSDSGLPVTLTSITPAVCTLSGGTVTFNATGNCVISANQAGDATYNPAAQVQQVITVTKKPQTITVTSPPTAAVFGDVFTINASSDSGLPVTFMSTTSSVCTVDAATGEVTTVGTGSCVITVSQAGDSVYDAATPVDVTIDVAKANQTITFTSTAPTDAQIDGTYSASATATSGLPVSFSSGDAAICTVDANGAVTFLAEGTCTVLADQAGDANWNPATQVSQTITVVKKPQTITFTSTPPNPAYVGGTYTLMAESSSGRPVTFTSADEAVCTVDDDGLVTFVGTGSCVVTANQAGDETWASAAELSQSFEIVAQPVETTTTTTQPGTQPTQPGTTPTNPAGPGTNPTSPSGSGSGGASRGGASRGVLPRTGSDTRNLGVVAGLLMVAGGAILLSRGRLAEES